MKILVIGLGFCSTIVVVDRGFSDLSQGSAATEFATALAVRPAAACRAVRLPRVERLFAQCNEHAVFGVVISCKSTVASCEPDDRVRVV